MGFKKCRNVEVHKSYYIQDVVIKFYERVATGNSILVVSKLNKENKQDSLTN